MPAIDIARLKTQAAVLVEKFDQSARFVSELREILDLYADRTLRCGRSGAGVRAAGLPRAARRAAPD